MSRSIQLAGQLASRGIIASEEALQHPLDSPAAMQRVRMAKDYIELAVLLSKVNVQ